MEIIQDRNPKDLMGERAHTPLTEKSLQEGREDYLFENPIDLNCIYFFCCCFFFSFSSLLLRFEGWGGGDEAELWGVGGGKGQQQSSVITLFYVLLVTRVQGSPDVLREFRTFPWRSWCRQNTWLTIRRPLAPHQTPEWTMTLRMDKPLRKWKVSSETPTRSTGSGNPGSSVLGACQKHDITKGKGKKLRYR